MPPTLPRKRLRMNSPSKEPASANKRRKATLYDDLDATSTSTSKGSKAILDSIDSSDEDDSLTDLSDADFEDVKISKPATEGDESDDDDNDDIEFEDVPAPETSMIDTSGPQGDLELTLHRDTRISLTNPFGDKKGPSKIERRVRNATHCMHVQSLLWHNAVRNSWLCDSEVQGIMMSHLPPRMFEELDRWKRTSGLDAGEKSPQKTKKISPAPKKKGRPKLKARSSSSRDWGDAADRLEVGAVDMSQGDPILRLLKTLSSWWRQRYRVTAPGLRKQGYMSLERIDRVTKAWVTTGGDSQGLFGERIRSIEEFRECATQCHGSRDVGAQLFTALLRALGIEARMVANLQPLGFGWNKMEEAEAEKDTSTLAIVQQQKAELVAKETPKKAGSGRPSKTDTQSGTKANGTKSSRKTRQAADPEVLDVELPDSDDDSVVEIDMTPKKSSKATFDRDLEFPHYWTEVLSPITKTYIPVDPIVKNIVATNRELVEALEPRGGKADKARQVMAYIVGYSKDGTAKDITIRYLKRQMMPGRTKGTRMPIEKIPVYDRNGKVKRYERYDWFKTAMSGYVRGTRKHPLTEVDEMEDSTDLKAAQPEKVIKEGEETLQYYKQSAEFCLERHLKREEALLPGSQVVKMFTIKAKGVGKGKALESQAPEEPVYSRKSVVNVKSAETWHKQGRAPRDGEHPLKRVPYRAATTNRRREIAEAEALSGEKVLQGLYSFEQTEWIIPPPIKDGIIPKNEYGNIDLFVEHMCPAGAVHVPFRGAAKVCRRLQIDYAEAVVDFDFGHRMAVPVIQGVVCPEEHHDQVMEEIRKDEKERTRKADEKKQKEVLRLWSKFIKGLRIVERIREDYGHIKDDVDVFRHNKGHHERETEPVADGADDMMDTEDMAGGFLVDGEDEGTPPPTRKIEETKRFTSNYFPDADEEDEGGDDDDDLIVDHGDGPSAPESRMQWAATEEEEERSDEELEEDEPEEEEAKELERSAENVSSRLRRPRQGLNYEE